MKTIWSRIITIIILTLFALMVMNLQGCVPTKKSIESSSEKITNTEKEKETISEVSTNKAINDKAEIHIPKSDTGDKHFDKKVDEAVDKILRAVNMQKKSGDNSYKLYYDLEKRMMMMEAIVGETKDSTNVSNSSEKSEKSVSQQLYEEIVKTKWPWWVYVLIVMLIWSYVKPIVMMLISPANVLTPLQKIFNKT